MTTFDGLVLHGRGETANLDLQFTTSFPQIQSIEV
jgi:hypothetical protein